jgi:zinc protease
VRFGRPDDYVRTLRSRLEAQTESGVRAAAAQAFRPDTLTWVIVGDLSQIETQIRQLPWSTVQVLDADGKPVR